MQGRNKLKVNIAYNIAYQILLIMAPLLTSPYVSRVLGQGGIGTYSYTYSLASSFSMVGLLGVTNYGNREIAAVQDDKEKRSRIFFEIYSVQALFSIAIILIYLGYVTLFCEPIYRTPMMIQLLTVMCSLFDINWYFFGVEKFKLTVTRNVIIKILNVAAIFTFVKKSGDVNIYIFIIALSLFVTNVAIWPFLRDEINFYRPRMIDIVRHIKPLIVLFIPILAITLYNRMDKVMIGWLSSIEETGLYENAEKIINIPKSLITAVGTVMLPRVANLYATGKKENAESYLDTTMEMTCIMSAAMMFGIAGIAKEFVPLFFGCEFAGVSILIIFISPTILFVSWANVIRTQYLIPLGKDVMFVKSVWLGAIGNLVINVCLIPRYGALGAVWGTVCAEVLVAVYQTIAVRRELKVFQYLKVAFCYNVIGSFMFAVVRLVSNIGTKGLDTVFLEICTGGIVFLVFGGMVYYLNHRK